MRPIWAIYSTFLQILKFALDVSLLCRDLFSFGLIINDNYSILFMY